ncbi:MAG: class F sortase [Candidatus Gracilibacteria bacterium]|nr:class F sortase [Candidatus Gracilibacteria bacterium]
MFFNLSDTRLSSSVYTSSPPLDEFTGSIQNTVSSGGLPARLIISKIGVNIPIEHVGLTKEGAMGVPKNFIHTAWFELGPHPGDVGSAVIDGHFGFIKKEPGAFNDLHHLRKGDMLSVQDEQGMTISFVVRESRIYQQDEDVPEVFESSDGKAHLNLITCQGIWNESKKSYPERLVVFTDMVP